MANQKGFDPKKQSIRVRIKSKSDYNSENKDNSPKKLQLPEKEKDQNLPALQRVQPSQVVDNSLSVEKSVPKQPKKRALAKETISWGSPGSPFFHSPKKKSLNIQSSWKQVVFSIVGAILVGTVLGFSVLHLFFSDRSLHSTRSIDDHLPAPSNEQSNTPNQAGVELPQQYSLPVLHVVMLQAGNYNDRNGAVKAVDQIRKKGMAAEMTEQSPFRIFSGIAKSRDEALKLSTYYQSQSINVFIKEMQLGGTITAHQLNVSPLVPLIEKSHQLCEQLSDSTIKHLGNKGDGAVTAGFFQKGWLAIHAEMKQEAEKVKNSLPSKAQAHLDQMMGALEQAIKNGEKLEQNSDASHIWKIQEELIRYTLSYELFLKEVQEI